MRVFIDAHFSNHIKGTKFKVDEAEVLSFGQRLTAAVGFNVYVEVLAIGTDEIIADGTVSVALAQT